MIVSSFNIVDIPLYDITGSRDHVKLSNNFTVGELRKSTFLLPEQWASITSIPFDMRLVYISQYIRDYFNVPITWLATHRSLEYDDFKGRKNTRATHSRSIAVDLTGDGVVKALKQSFDAKDDLYNTLVSMGMSSIGFYFDKNFVHIDVDHPRTDGQTRTWLSKKKA